MSSLSLLFVSLLVLSFCFSERPRHVVVMLLLRVTPPTREGRYDSVSCIKTPPGGWFGNDRML